MPYITNYITNDRFHRQHKTPCAAQIHKFVIFLAIMFHIQSVFCGRSFTVSFFLCDPAVMQGLKQNPSFRSVTL